VLGANGHGKSSIVNVVDLALFGPESRSWVPYLTVGASGTELMVELEFEHAGERYRVRRGYSGRGAGKSTLDLERYLDDVATTKSTLDWEPLTLGSAKETQAKLEEILGFTRRTLRASSLLLQGDGAAFTEADPRDRKRILADTLGLDRWESLRAAVRRDLRVAEQEITRIDGRLQGVTAESLAAEHDAIGDRLFACEQAAKTAAAELASAETALEQAAAAVQAAKDVEAERATVKAQVDAAAAALASATQLQRDTITAEEQAGVVRDELATMPTSTKTAALEQREHELTAALEQHRELVRARDEQLRLRDLRETEKRAVAAQAAAAGRKASELDEKIQHLEAGEIDTCPTCEQQLHADARAATIGSLRAQAQAAIDEARALDEQAAAIELPDVPDAPEPSTAAGQLEQVRGVLRAAREAELQRTRLEERLAGYEALIARASEPEYLQSITAAEKNLLAALETAAKLPDPGDNTPLEQAAAQARTQVEHHRTQLADAQRQKAVEEERLAQISTRAAQHEIDFAARATLLGEIDLLAILEQAYGPDGIPALIVENAAIPQIEVEANRILTALGGTTHGCRLELRTDRAKSDGGIRQDVLDIQVVTPAGEREYASFSGGERTRLNLALRIALARLLATRRGADSRILAIDEPEFLDDDGTAALVDVLRELEQHGVFDRVYLVSHVPALRDSFDQVLEVMKENDRSRVLGAAREAVAA
jgi:exonuclease SbcC